MNALKWLLAAPFRLIGALIVAVGYVLAFVLGLGLVAGGTALTLTGPGAILGVPAIVLGILVLRELFEEERRVQHLPLPVEEADDEATPAAAPQPAAGHVIHQPAGYAQVGTVAAPPPRQRTRHYRPRPQWCWVPGHWTLG